TLELRMMALGSWPWAMALRSSNRRLRIMAMPMSLAPIFSLVRSAMRPCPTQALMSWLMTWLEIHRPCSSLIGLTQVGTLSWTEGSPRFGTRLTDHDNVSVLV